MKAMTALSALTLGALAACGDAPAPSPQPQLQSEAEAPKLPANGAFVGRVWVSATPGAALGTILVFLPDGTLLMDSCFETFRLSKWGVAGDHLRWLEDTIPIEAAVSVHGRDELRLEVAGQDEEQVYISASVPYVCPDMPR
ncbi:MAG TPA: hypothetical protein VNQ81_12090 [Povalibacter sp.]|nr:hypothetical protein [Povalibacter sp.]